MARFRCSTCKKEFKRNYNLKSHEKSVHHQKVLKLKCPLWPKCKKIHRATGFYANLSNLKVHFKKHHKKYKLERKDVRKKWIDKNGGMFS